jgi:hypothetical protein
MHTIQIQAYQRRKECMDSSQRLSQRQQDMKRDRYDLDHATFLNFELLSALLAQYGGCPLSPSAQGTSSPEHLV